MKSIRTSLAISFFTVCGCGAPNVSSPTTTIQAKSTDRASDLSPHTTAVEEASPPKTEPRQATKTFATDPETGALLVSLKDLNVKPVLDISPSLALPEWLKSLDGKQVRVQGSMYPLTGTNAFSRFQLVYRDPATQVITVDAYKSIFVTLVDGTTTTIPANDRLVDVVGRFKINLEIEDGQVMSLYNIENATITAADR